MASLNNLLDEQERGLKFDAQNWGRKGEDGGTEEVAVRTLSSVPSQPGLTGKSQGPVKDPVSCWCKPLIPALLVAQ